MIQFHNDNTSGQIKDGYSLSTRVVFPSIATGNEHDLKREGGRQSKIQNTYS